MLQQQDRAGDSVAVSLLADTSRRLCLANDQIDVCIAVPQGVVFDTTALSSFGYRSSANTLHPREAVCRALHTAYMVAFVAFTPSGENSTWSSQDYSALAALLAPQQSAFLASCTHSLQVNVQLYTTTCDVSYRRGRRRQATLPSFAQPSHFVPPM